MPLESLQYNRSWVWSVIYDYWTGRDWRWLSIMQLWNSRCDSALYNRTLPFDIQLFSLRQREQADQTHVLSSELSKLLTTVMIHTMSLFNTAGVLFSAFLFSPIPLLKYSPHQCPHPPTPTLVTSSTETTALLLLLLTFTLLKFSQLEF